MCCVCLGLNCCPIASSSTTNPTRTGLGSNQSLSHGMTWDCFVVLLSASKQFFFPLMARQPPVGYGLFIVEASRSHSDTPRFGRTPLEEWSARRRDLCLTTHNTHERETFMLAVGFEPAIPKSERPQTHAVDRVAAGISASMEMSD